MKLMKKLLTMGLALSLAAALIACGGKGQDADAAPADTTAAADSADESGAAAEIASPQDLADKKISAQRGTVGDSLAQELSTDADKLVTTYEKYVDAVQALEQDKVTAIIMDERPAKRFVDEREGLVIMEEALTEESYAVAIKKGNVEMKKAIDEALTELKENGKLQAIIDKYNSDTPVKPEDIDLNKGAAGGTLTVGLEAGFAPYELKVGDGYIGIDIEMMAEVAKIMDRELVIENMNFDALPGAVNSGKIDCIAAGMTVTPEREQNMDFSVPYVEGARQVALIKAADYSGPVAK